MGCGIHVRQPARTISHGIHARPIGNQGGDSIHKTLRR
jgi:hypothetical protein